MPAPDVRAVHAVLQQSTKTGLLPFWDTLTWTGQTVGEQPPGTASERLLIGHDKVDQKAIYAQYLTGGAHKKVIAYYKEGNPQKLLLTALEYSVLVDPFSYFRIASWIKADFLRFTSTFIKACFSLKGLTRGAAYEVTRNFKDVLGRAVAALERRRKEQQVILENRQKQQMISSQPGNEANESSQLINSTMPIRTPQSQVQPREQSDISSSSIQAIETDTIDLAHEIQGSPERDLHEGTRNSGSTAQLRAFSHSKPLSQRTPRLTLVLKSPSQKRKSLGMFGGMPERKHARLGSRHTSTQTGERPVSNSALVTTTKEAVPLPASDDEESLFIPETTATQAALLRRDQTSESVPTYRQVRKALRRHRTPDSVIGPSSPPETPKKEPEAPDVDEQVRRYLEMESLIRTSTVEVQRLKTYIKEYKQEEGALELGLQALDKEADNKKQEVLANAALKKDEVRKRLEAEMAAIDMEAASSVNQITAGTPKEKTILEGVVERRVKEELRITQKTRILEDTEAALEALQKAGGFKLGVAVMAKKQQD